MKQLVILGAGTAGTIMAHRLRRSLPEDTWSIVIVDKDDRHVYQPGLLFVPFGACRPSDLIRPRRLTLPSGIDVHLEGIAAVDPERKIVRLEGGAEVRWDILVVATGSRIVPEETPGLTAAGWRESIFDFYTLEGAAALAPVLDTWKGGRIVINFADVPIKCPVAPLEFAFLVDAFLTRRGLRAATELVYATPLDGAFTKPRASALLSALLGNKGIQVEANFALAKVDGAQRVMEAYDGRTLAYDLLVTVPLHAGADVVRRADMGDAQGFVATHKHTLQSKRWDHVFVIGDATDLPTSKAGSVAHFQSEVLAANIVRYTKGQAPEPAFDGHANCFIETGHDKALLIDFNYETEPLPGRFPLPAIGPFSLLGESRANHMGKLGFKWVYWNLLLAGKDLPIDHHMLMAGKWS